MMRRTVLALAAAGALFACRAMDRTITHGADGEREWARRLAEAVPTGAPADSVLTLMERNGFRCAESALGAAGLRCEKRSDRRGPTRRRWEALFDLDSARRVAHVRGATSLDRP